MPPPSPFARRRTLPIRIGRGGIVEFRHVATGHPLTLHLVNHDEVGCLLEVDGHLAAFSIARLGPDSTDQTDPTNESTQENAHP